MGRVPTDLTFGEGELVVAEVFGPTFQGEGPSIGRRAGFVRLGRCNLDCSWCDTPYTWDWGRHDPARELRLESVESVLDQLDAMSPERVIITGGEPMLQQRRLGPLLYGCDERGWPIEIETNGTIIPDEHMVQLVRQWNVSPKLANSCIPFDKRIRAEALAALTATGRAVFKFVVTQPADLDEVGNLVDAYGLENVWIMPEGTDPMTMLERAQQLVDPVLAHGWNLTLRLHILLWGDQRGR